MSGLQGSTGAGRMVLSPWPRNASWQPVASVCRASFGAPKVGFRVSLLLLLMLALLLLLLVVVLLLPQVSPIFSQEYQPHIHLGQHRAVNPKPQTLNPEPQDPEALNPKPRRRRTRSSDAPSSGRDAWSPLSADRVLI